MSHRTLNLTTKNAGIQAFVWPHLTSPMRHFANAFVIKQALLGSGAPNASMWCFIVLHSWVACPHRCIPYKFNKYINIQMNSKMYLLNLCRRHHQTCCPGLAVKTSAGFHPPMYSAVCQLQFHLAVQHDSTDMMNKKWATSTNVVRHFVTACSNLTLPCTVHRHSFPLSFSPTLAET